MSRTRVIAAGLVVVVAAVLAVALLDGDGDAGRPDRDGVLTVTMAEYAFTPETWTVTADEPVTFRFVNTDDVTHHVSMGRGLTESDDRAVAFETDLLDGLDVTITPASARFEPEAPYAGTVVGVRGGETAELTVTLPADRVGEWHVGCFTGLGCHFRAGLDAVLTIESPDA